MYRYVCVCVCVCVVCVTHFARNSITELFGAIPVFDPKPMPVCARAHRRHAAATLCGRFSLLRATGTARAVTPTTPPRPCVRRCANAVTATAVIKARLHGSQGGLEHIMAAVEKLGKRHAEHIKVYGEHNDRRYVGVARRTAASRELRPHVRTRARESPPIVSPANMRRPTSTHSQLASETAARRSASRPRPSACVLLLGLQSHRRNVARSRTQDGRGYLEDRRPASNMDPYVVTHILVETTLLKD